MGLHIDNCIEKYKSLFAESNIAKKAGESDDAYGIRIRGIHNEFFRFFFIEMNDALFEGEYLGDDYLEKIKEIENYLTNETLDNNSNRYPEAVIVCLKDLRDAVFTIQKKIKQGNEELLVAITTNDYIKYDNDDAYKLSWAWRICSINLLYIDHTLIDEKNYREILINIFCKIQSETNGLGNKDLLDVFEKLKNKCAFLLRKILAHDRDKTLYYSIDYETKSIDEIINNDNHNKDFISLFRNMQPDKIGIEKVAYDYQEKFLKSEFSPIGFIVLAYYYRKSKTNAASRFDKLCKYFETYENEPSKSQICTYDKYAIRSIKNYIYNCRFSFRLELKSYTIESLKKDIEDIGEMQEETGFENYHPYKKALEYLDNYFSKHTTIEDTLDKDTVLLFNDIFEKYKATYETCLKKHFSPFQLPRDNCKNDMGVFIASSFARPISPSKLNDGERHFRETKQYLKIRLRLSEREEEIKEIASNLNSFRRESFEYLGVFIAVITFLFGSIQLFGKDTINTKTNITNIVSLGIVLGIFMALLYIILYCKNKSKIIIILFSFIAFCIGTFILYNKFAYFLAFLTI